MRVVDEVISMTESVISITDSYMRVVDEVRAPQDAAPCRATIPRNQQIHLGSEGCDPMYRATIPRNQQIHLGSAGCDPM